MYGCESWTIKKAECISPSNEYSGLISFRMDWFDLPVVQGTLKSLPQHHSSEASILLCSVFFMVQLSHPYMTTGKTIALTRWTFVSKMMSLLFNTMSKFVIAFLLRSKHLLISWLQSPSSVILEHKKIKSVTVFTFLPSICHAVMQPDAMILVFWMLSSKPAFHSPFSPSSRGSLVPVHFLPCVASSAYLRLLIFLPAILIPACDSSSLAGGKEPTQPEWAYHFIQWESLSVSCSMYSCVLLRQMHD